MTDQTFSAKQVARRIGTDPKTFRKWLRSSASPYDAVGQGKRYEFEKTELPQIDKLFHTWHDKAAKTNGQVKPVPTKPLDDQTKDELAAQEVIDALEDWGEPSAEELEDLEDLDLEDLDEEV